MNDRKPLLSPEEMERLRVEFWTTPTGKYPIGNDLAQAVSEWYEQKITSGELIHRDELRDGVLSLIGTVANNMFYDTVRACEKQWPVDKPDWPPIPRADTVMKDGMDGMEKDFTKMVE